MKTFCAFAALAAAFLAAHSDAYVYLEEAEVLPTSPGNCLWKEVDDSGLTEFSIHPAGSSWNKKGCERVRCFRREEKLYLEVAGCGVASVEAPCKMLPIDPSKTYPECCPQPWCP